MNNNRYVDKGSADRGNAEASRIEALIEQAGGIFRYMQGASPRRQENIKS